MNLAPFGYVNNPKIRNIEPHPTNAKILKRAFQEYAKGMHTYKSLSEFLADLSVVSRSGTPLAKASIKGILTSRAYLGFVKHGDKWFEGSFEPIISPSLFEAVQRVLKDKEKPNRKNRNKHNFPFTGLSCCGECASIITAQFAKGNGGIYRYYRCSKKKGKCSQSYVQEKNFAEQL